VADKGHQYLLLVAEDLIFLTDGGDAGLERSG
jgi:hypothetical protein